MSRDSILDLARLIPDEDLDVIYRILVKFVPDDVLLPEDIIALEEAENDIKNGNLYSHDEVWD